MGKLKLTVHESATFSSVLVVRKPKQIAPTHVSV